MISLARQTSGVITILWGFLAPFAPSGRLGRFAFDHQSSRLRLTPDIALLRFLGGANEPKKSLQAEEENMSTCRTSALPVAAMLATLLVGGAAQAACDETNWKDCAGKPWMTGKPDTPIGEA